MVLTNKLKTTHPQGELQTVNQITANRWPLSTPGGRFYAELADDLPVTREGSLMFFFQFLKEGGRWEEFIADTPLHYEGNQGSGANNVFGTLFLSILRGHFRYAHINSVRGDGVNPQLLGMDKVVSDDTVRRALAKLSDTTVARDWLENHLIDSIAPALIEPWILDIDTTIKTIYGHQEGAKKGYNATKKGRPSHSYHSYFVANLRLALGVDVCPGNKSSALEGMPGLWRVLEALGGDKQPALIRGDCGYGNERIMAECEQRGLKYLFKLRNTPNVKYLVKDCMRKSGGWVDTGDGWESMEAILKLSGWTKERRVVLVRQKPSARSRAISKPNLLPGDQWLPSGAPWSGEITVLVTSLDEKDFPTEAMPRLYRERADMENNYDKLKNQWGWGGFTTRKMEPCQLAAMFIALVYNWWGLYVRFYDPEHHREAVTTRPYLMEGVGRQVQSGGQKTIKLSFTHEKGKQIAEAVSLISNKLHEFGLIAAQWTIPQRWAYLLSCVLRPLLRGKWLAGVPTEGQRFLIE